MMEVQQRIATKVTKPSEQSNKKCCLQRADPALRVALQRGADADEAAAGTVHHAKGVVLLLLHALILDNASL